MSEIYSKWQDLTLQLSRDEKSKSAKYLFQPKPISAEIPSTLEVITDLPVESKIDLATQSLNQLSSNDRDKVINGVIGSPSTGNSTDLLWKIFVSALSLVFVGAALALMFGMFTKIGPGENFVKPEVIFTLWSTVTAYLVGLFSPSPKNDKE